MRVVIATLALLVVMPGICWSDELLRCGSGLVSPDMSSADFLRRCGEPSSRSVSTQELQDAYGVRVGTMTTEIWRYDGDSNAPSMVVTVVDGRIQSIEQRK
jgi:hypothetical protein